MRVGCALVGVAIVAGGCSSGSPGGSKSSSSSSARTLTSQPDVAADLFGRLRAAKAKITTVHFEDSIEASDVRSASGTVELRASGDARLSDGKMTAIDMTIDTGSRHGEIISDANAVYLRLDGRNAPNGKPWVKFGAKTPDEYLALFAAFGYLVGPGSPAFTATFEPSASNVRRRLAMTDAGVSVTPYAMDVDAAKLSGAATVLRKLIDPSATLQVTVTVDGQGRPVTLTANGHAGPTDLECEATYSKYDRAVAIAAPPKSQVGT